MGLLGITLDGRYEIVGKLGAGGMALVFLAKDRELDRQVAVKVMQRSIASSPRLLERFRREVATCAKVHHPNVVQIFGYGILKDGSPYYVMELLQCKSLSQIVKEEGALPEEEVIEILTAVADALQEIHNQGLVHRDLKPGNIMLPQRGRPKVVDFGLVHDDSLTQLTKTGEMVGTPLYCSPELVEGLDVDGRSDIFQLGAICYELLTGKQAFHANSMEGVLGKIITGQCPSLREYEKKLKHPWQPFLNKCLKADPEKRFQSANEVVEALSDLDNFKERNVAKDTGAQSVIEFDSSISTSAERAKTRKVLPILLVFFFCFMALALVLSRRGSEERDYSTNRELPQRFESPKLVELSMLQINYTKTLKGKCSLSFDNGLASRQLDLNKGKALSTNLRTQKIRLTPCIIERTKLKLVHEETNKEWFFEISPEKIFSQLFSSLDRLTDQELTRLCQDLYHTRQELNKAYGSLGQEDFNERALPTMVKVLAQYGLDENTIGALKKNLPIILDGRVKAGQPLSHRLLPLQHIESAAWCDQGFTMPWPSVPKLLGIFIEKPDSPADSKLRKIASNPLCDLHSDKPWCWMSTATVIEGERKNPPAMRIVFRGIVEKLIQNYAKNNGKGEHTPNIQDITSQRNFFFHIGDDVTPWPLRGSNLSLVIRLFSRAFCLQMRINGKGPISLTNSPFLATTKNPSANMPATRYNIPIDTSWLQKGENELSLTVIPCPGTRPNAALSLRKLDVWSL